MVGKKQFLFQYEYGQKRYKVGKEVYYTISELPKIIQGKLLTIDGDPDCELYGTFEKVI